MSSYWIIYQDIENQLINKMRKKITQSIGILLLIVGSFQVSAVEYLDGIVAVVEEGIILESELAQEVASVVIKLKASNVQIPPENILYKQVLERLIIDALQSQLAQRAGIKVSDEMLNSSLQAIAQQNGMDFEGFKQEIENTAQGLYCKLEEHPALLNGLRATRVTADAAMLALAVQAGGIGLHDLLIAPAMLSVTSYLAESAIGSYLQRAETELKHQQLNAVKQQLFIQVIQQALTGLPEKMMRNTYFNISTRQLAEAEAQLEQKRHGLRIL